MDKNKNGWSLVLLAYTAWGLLPGYWKLFASVSPLEVLAHRIIWSALFLGALLAYQGKLQTSFALFKDLKTMKALCVSTLFIVLNWLMYVWALGRGYFLESGLGYYLCPLLTLALGRFVLKEKLSALQTRAVCIVSLGVAVKILTTGHLPFIALSLATTFAVYTLIRKIAAVEPMQGLFIETLLSLVPAVAYLSYALWRGDASFLHRGVGVDLLLCSTGIITALPLLWLVTGAPSTPLQLIAIIQFLSPTLMVLTGVLAGDALKFTELPGYLLIWGGIAVYLWPSIQSATTYLERLKADKTSLSRQSHRSV